MAARQFLVLELFRVQVLVPGVQIGRTFPSDAYANMCSCHARREYGPSTSRRNSTAGRGASGARAFVLADRARSSALKKSTVAYHARRLGDPGERQLRSAIRLGRDPGRLRLWSLDAGVRRQQFGFSQRSWSQGRQTRRQSFHGHAPATSSLCSARAPRETVAAFRKKRLIDEGIKEDRCEQCGITHWRGRKLSIQLHHKNGDGTDNRIENLDLAMPQLPLADRHLRRAKRTPQAQSRPTPGPDPAALDPSDRRRRMALYAEMTRYGGSLDG